MDRSPSKLSHIYEQLRQEVLDGTWKVGVKLPNEVVLAKRFGCSLGTVNKAVSLLAHDGFVDKRARLGTTVTSNSGKPAATPAALDAFAFIYPSDQHEGVWRTVKGFQAAAGKRQRRVLMLPTGTDYEKEVEYLSRLAEFDVRGAVLYPIIPTPRDQVLLSKIIVESPFAIVLTNMSLPGLGNPSVLLDNFHAGYTMTAHLLARGLKRIGFFGNELLSPSIVDRYQGYCWALEEAGLPLEPARVLLEPTMRPDFRDPVREPAELARRYFRQTDDVEGVVCSGDFLARGIIRAASELGRSVPSDLKVTGIDDFAFEAKHEIPLTTYQVPCERIGQRAFEILDSIVVKKPAFQLNTLVRGEIVVRESA